MKKILGYGYKLSSEPLDEALLNYRGTGGIADGLHKNAREVIDAIEYDKKEGIISKSAKPKIFKVVAEVM